MAVELAISKSLILPLELSEAIVECDLGNTKELYSLSTTAVIYLHCKLSPINNDVAVTLRILYFTCKLVTDSE